jgi:hypothetical protein
MLNVLDNLLSVAMLSDKVLPAQVFEPSPIDISLLCALTPVFTRELSVSLHE